MSVYFDVNWSANTIVPKGLASSAGDETIQPVFPMSIQLWVRMVDSEDRPDDGQQTIWWYGDKNAPDVVVALVLLNRSRMSSDDRKIRLRVGASYPDIGDLESAGQITMNLWHLITVVIEYDSGTETLTHTMYIDDEDPVSISDSPLNEPDVGAFDRFCVGRAGKNSTSQPRDPAHCMIEQVAIWKDRVITESEHGAIYASSDAAFSGLRRAPDVVTDPTMGWWMLTGHHRHALDVRNGQNVPDAGEIANVITALDPAPDMQVLENTTGDPPPTWTVESPLVFYKPQSVASFPERPKKLAVTRRSPRFTFFQKPELFPPWDSLSLEGKHPVYDDPNCLVLGRCAFIDGNADGRSAPFYRDNDYNPQSYITNIARRIADWSEFQGLWSGVDPRFSDHDPYPGAVFVQTIGLQHDAAGTTSEPNLSYGTFGLNVTEETPWGEDGDNQGIPLQQHPRDSLVSTQTTSTLGDWFVSLYAANGIALVRDWADGFWASLDKELARRKRGGTGPSLAEPGRAIWDYESSPQPEKFCQQFAPTTGADGNWYFHNCMNGAQSCSGGDIDPRWTGANAEELVEIDDGGGWQGATLQDLVTDMYIRLPDIEKGLNQPENDDFRADIVGWDSPFRQEAVYQSLQQPAESTFPNLQWSNYWDLSADNPAFQSYFRAVKKNYNTPSVARIRTKYSAPVIYPTPGAQIDEFADPSNFPVGPRTKTGAFLGFVSAVIDACVNAEHPLPLQPWIAASGSQIIQGTGPSAELKYTVTQADLRAVLQFCWQRGCDEFNMFVAASSTEDLPDDGEGWNGGVAGQQNGDNDPSEQADFDGTYEEVKALRDHIEFCASAQHDRVCRTMRHSRRV